MSYSPNFTAEVHGSPLGSGLAQGLIGPGKESMSEGPACLFLWRVSATHTNGWGGKSLEAVGD